MNEKRNGIKNVSPAAWTALEKLILDKEEEILGGALPGETDFLNDDDKPAVEDKPKQIEDKDAEFELDSSEDNESLASDDEIDDVDGEAACRALHFKSEGDRLFKDCKWREAIDKYGEALGHQALAALFGNRALCYMKIGEYERAEIDCDAAIDMDPKYKRIYRRRAALRLRRKFYFGAAKDLQSLIILSGATLDPILIEEYKILLPLARFSLFNTPITPEDSLYPQFVQMENEFVSTFVCAKEKSATESSNRKLWSNAVENLTIATMVAPHSARLYAQRALANLQLHLSVSAELDATRALSLDPDNREYYLLRAKIRKRKNDPTGSAEDEKEARRLLSSNVHSTTDELDVETSTQTVKKKRTEEPTEEFGHLLMRIPVQDVYSSGADDVRDLSHVFSFVQSRLVS